MYRKPSHGRALHLPHFGVSSAFWNGGAGPDDGQALSGVPNGILETERGYELEHHQSCTRCHRIAGLHLCRCRHDRAPASAQSAPPPQGWFKVCNKQDDNDICVVQNIQMAPSGQLITAVGLITVSGKINRKMMQVTVPPARLIPPGILFQVDGAKGTKVDYAVCMPDKCIAEIPLTDGMIASLKKGGEMVVTSINFQRTPNPIKLSLDGLHRRL